MLLSRRAVLILCGTLLGETKPLDAAQWKVSGALKQALLFNDNISLGFGGRTPVVGYLLGPTVEARRRTKALDIALEGQGDIRRYDDSAWNCDNFGFGMNSRYRARRNLFSLDAGYMRTCAYLQQLRDTGVLIPSTLSDTVRVSPSWTWQWTRRSQLYVEGGYFKTSYGNVRQAGTGVSAFNYVGNDTYSLLLGANHAWSRALSLNGGFQFNAIQYDRSRTTSNVSSQNLYGAQVGANYEFRRPWSMSAGVGLRWVDSWLVQTDGSEHLRTHLGHVANISLRYRGESNGVALGYSNSIVPSAFGDTRQLHTLSGEYTHELGHRLFLNLGAGFSRSDPLQSGTGQAVSNNLRRDYFSGSADLTWRFARDWEMKAGYLYRRQDFQDQNGTGDANLVMLSLSYTWPGWRVSR